MEGKEYKVVPPQRQSIQYNHQKRPDSSRVKNYIPRDKLVQKRGVSMSTETSYKQRMKTIAERETNKLNYGKSTNTKLEDTVSGNQTLSPKNSYNNGEIPVEVSEMIRENQKPRVAESKPKKVFAKKNQ